MQKDTIEKRINYLRTREYASKLEYKALYTEVLDALSIHDTVNRIKVKAYLMDINEDLRKLELELCLTNQS